MHIYILISTDHTFTLHWYKFVCQVKKSVFKLSVLTYKLMEPQLNRDTGFLARDIRNFVEIFWNFLNRHGDNDLITGSCCLNTGVCVNHLGIFSDYNHRDLTLVICLIKCRGISQKIRFIFISQTREEQKTIQRSVIQQGQPW